MKVKRVYVSPELIAVMLTTGYELKGQLKVTEGLPDNATLTAIGWDVPTRCWAFDFQHESFDWVMEGVNPPVLRICVERKSETIADTLSA